MYAIFSLGYINIYSFHVTGFLSYFATSKSSGPWKTLRVGLYPRNPCSLSGGKSGAATVPGAESSGPTPARSTSSYYWGPSWSLFPRTFRWKWSPGSYPLEGKKFFWFLASDQLNIRAPCNYAIDVTMETLNLLHLLMTVFFSSISTRLKC